MSEGDQLPCSHLIHTSAVHRERSARRSRITSTTNRATGTRIVCGDALGPCLESLLSFCLGVEGFYHVNRHEGQRSRQYMEHALSRSVFAFKARGATARVATRTSLRRAIT